MRRQEEHTHGVIARGIAWLAVLACRFPRTVLFFTFVTCAASLLYTFTCLSYHTSRNDLISQGKDYLQRWQQYVAEFGDDEDMVVVAQGGKEEMKQALDTLATKIQQHPQHFDRLFYRVDLSHLKDRALLFLPIDQIHRIQNELRGMHMLLAPPVLAQLDPLFSWKSLTLQQLLQEADRKVQAQLNAVGTNSKVDPFLDQLAVICDSAAHYLDDPADYRNPWRSILPAESKQEDILAQPKYFFSADGSFAFLLVRPIFREAGSFTSEKACVETLRGIINEMKATHPNVEFGLTGLPVLENDEMQASQDDSQRASLFALLGVALLYFAVYRGARYPLMTVASLLIGTIWALGWLTLTIGHLNILSSAFAVMLIGMGDYGVLWVARYQQESQAGMNPISATRETALHVGPGILTAACTTAMAFFAAMLADLKAVAELGWIAGCGVILCAIACIVVMPALLMLFGERKTAENDQPVVLSLQEARDRNRTWLPDLVARPKWVLAGTLFAALLLCWWTLGIKYDHNLLHLQAQHLDSVRWERKLIDRTAGASWHALSYTTTREEALALKKKFEQLPLVSQVVEVASLVPLDQERKLESLRDIQERLRLLPKRGQVIPHDTPDVESVIRAAQRLKADLGKLALTNPGISPGSLPQKLDQVLQRLNESTITSHRLRDFQQNLTRDLSEDLHQLRDVSTPSAIEVADVPVYLRERYIGQNGKWLLRVFCKACLWEYAPLEAFAKQIISVDAHATGKPFTTLEGLRALRNGFLWAGIYALMAMIIVLLLDFGNVKHLLLALLPLALGMVMTTGLMGLLGIPLNPANLIAFPLILGVGADNGVHVVHDYRQRGRGKRYLLNLATGRGILVAALTTILGFGTLLISQHQGLKSLGLVLTLGVSCCMLSSLVFLPCLLSVLSVRAKHRSAVKLPFPHRKAA